MTDDTFAWKYSYRLFSGMIEELVHNSVVVMSNNLFVINVPNEVKYEIHQHVL